MPLSPASRSDPPVSPDQVETTLRELVQTVDLGSPRSGPGRPRILPSALLWMGMIVCVLQGWSSQRSLWRLLSITGLWDQPRIPVGDEAVYRRLAQSDSTVLETFFHQISAMLRTRLARWETIGCADLAPFAAGVFALDRTTLDPVLRSLPALRNVPPGDHILLPGSLHGAFDLRTQQWRALHYTDHPHQNEKVHARDLVADLPTGSLMVMDRGYFGFKLLDDLTDAGHHWLMRCPANLSLNVLHTFVQRDDITDQVIEMGIYKNDRAKHAVRLVRIRVGKKVYRYLTNVRDPQMLSATGIARLYARRWDIEMAFQLIKQHLGLHLLWSAKPNVVLQQVWAVLIIAQVVQAIRLEIAGRAGVDPFEVSVPLLVEWLPRLAARGVDPIATMVAEGRKAEIIRPSRRKRPPDPGLDPADIAPAPDDLVLVRKPRYRPRPAPATRKR